MKRLLDKAHTRTPRCFPYPESRTLAMLGMLEGFPPVGNPPTVTAPARKSIVSDRTEFVSTFLFGSSIPPLHAIWTGSACAIGLMANTATATSHPQLRRR